MKNGTSNSAGHSCQVQLCDSIGSSSTALTESDFSNKNGADFCCISGADLSCANIRDLCEVDGTLYYNLLQKR